MSLFTKKTLNSNTKKYLYYILKAQAAAIAIANISCSIHSLHHGHTHVFQLSSVRQKQRCLYHLVNLYNISYTSYPRVTCFTRTKRRCCLFHRQSADYFLVSTATAWWAFFQQKKRGHWLNFWCTGGISHILREMAQF